MKEKVIKKNTTYSSWLREHISLAKKEKNNKTKTIKDLAKSRLPIQTWKKENISENIDNLLYQK